MKSVLIILSVVLIYLLKPISSLGQGDNKSAEKNAITISEAIKRKMIEVDILGVSDERMYRELIDKEGLHYGKCMTIFVKSKCDTFFMAKLPCGLQLVPLDSTFQTMIVTKSVLLPVEPGIAYPTRVYAMCGEIHDFPPFVGSLYKVGSMANRNTRRLAKYFDEHYIQNMAGQHTLWAFTDAADVKELKKYGADSISLKLCEDILDEMAIETKLNAKKKISNETKELKKKHGIFLSEFVVYLFGGLILVLAGITTFLMIKKKGGSNLPMS
jgi:hypothetical protein